MTRFPRPGPALGAALLFLAVVTASGVGAICLAHREHRARPAAGDGADPAEAAPRPTLAGSGAALPLVRVLAEAFAEKGGNPIAIPPSIGSGGGLAAVRDRAIDCAVVSRPLRSGEADGLRVVALARAPLGLVGGKGLPKRIPAAEFLALLAGEQEDLEEREVHLVLREPGDSGVQALGHRWPAFAHAYDLALVRGRQPVVLTDADMVRALVPGRTAMGFVDLGTLALEELPLHPIELTGAPFATVTRPFLLVCRPDPSPPVADFLDWLATAEVRRLIARHGYLAGEVP